MSSVPTDKAVEAAAYLIERVTESGEPFSSSLRFFPEPESATVKVTPLVRAASTASAEAGEPVAWRYCYEPGLQWHVAEFEDQLPIKAAFPSLIVTPLYALPPPEQAMAERVEPEHKRARREILEAAMALDGSDFAGDIEAHDSDAKTVAIVVAAYGWTLSSTGRLCGLVGGDMGYAATNIVIDLADIPVPKALEALRLHVAYEALPRDRGGKTGPKGRAWTAFINSRDAALKAPSVTGGVE